ncbi:MAG: hypothetical protein ACK5GZ_05945 [Cyanobium sp.]|jgi:hypothetical protein
MTQTLTSRGAVQIGLRLDVATAELLQAAAAAEGIPRLATYLRLAVRTHVVQSRSIPPDLQSNLAARIGGPNLPGHLQQHMQNQSAEALPVVISDDAQP